MSYPATFEMPTTDGLTGLINGAYFRHLLREKLLKEAQTNEEPLALATFDLDNMMVLNTTYGHKAGDTILIEVAGVLAKTMPESAITCRYGGDEFIVALPATRLDDAFSLMEEFRRRVAALKFEEMPDMQVTCSIGLAAFPTNGANDVDLMRESDQALYTAKITGRNKISLPLADSRMVTKTSHYTATQLERLALLAKGLKRNEAMLLREALDDVLKKYSDQFKL